MKISCPNCSAAYELDDGRVPPAGLSIKCPKCKKPFTVHKPKPGETAKPATKGAVPLPGQQGAKLAAAAKPAGGRPAAKKPGSAVPLPGLGEAAAASEAAGGPGAVPLPGMAEGAAPPTVPDGAVPLPGLDPDSALDRTATDFRPAPAPPRSAPPKVPGAVPLPGLDEDAAPSRPAAAGGDDPFANIDLGAPAPAKSGPRKPAARTDESLSLDMPEPPPSAPPRAGGGVDPATAVVPKGQAPKSAADDGLNFDFVEAPASKPASAPPGGSDMLDFVDDKAAGDKKKRPPPPLVGKPAAGEPQEEMLFPEAGAAPSDEAGSKKAEKERKKSGRATQDREDRARRKAMRGPGVVGPAVRGFAQSLKQPRRMVAVVFLLAIVAVVVLGFRARRTPAGFFWVNKYLPSKKAATAAETKVIERGLAKLGQGDFAGAREAVAAAAQLIAVLPDDEDVRAFFVLAASDLKLEYGQVGADWDQAKRVVEKMKANKPAQNRARGAFALANGEAAKGKQLLAAMGDAPNADQESSWLYAESLVLSGEPGRAAQVLDNALKRGSDTKLLLLRGEVARDKDQLADAADFYKKALEKSPGNGGALVELAGVRLRQNDSAAAGELLGKALDTDVRKSLDAAEEARADMLRGRLLAARDHKGAEAAYERAVALDPNSPKVHEAYGQFRLSRREWDKAARQFEAAIANGGSAAAYAGAARAYLGLNRLLEADKDVNLAVAKDPGDASSLYLQGRVADAIGKAEEAFRKYESALQKKPDLIEALAAEGMVWISRGDKAKAKERLDTALKTPGEKMTALEDEAVGDLALALGNKDQAREAYARALSKDPDDPLAHFGMGKALSAQGALGEARTQMQTALAELDSDASIFYEYGSLLRRMGDREGALESLRKAVKIDGKEPRYRARLGAVLVERGQFEEAEAQLRQAVLLNDRYAEGLFFLARALAGRKNLAEAVDNMKKAVEIDPDNGEYLYWLGLIYEQGQQVQDAIDAFSRAIEKNAKNPDAYEHLGLNLMVENRFPEAVAAFKKAAELDPKRARLSAEVGDAEQQSGDVDGAIRDFQRALAQDSNLTGVWTKLGIAYKDKDCKGCRTKALDALKRATREDPTDATAHHELGYMLKDDGRRREAIAEFRRYLELRPDAGDLATVQDDIYYLQEESRRSP